MSLGHDPELPAGFQDADLELGELTRRAQAEAAARRRGHCNHTWIQGPPGRENWKCLHCGQEFDSDPWAREERIGALGRYRFTSPYGNAAPWEEIFADDDTAHDYAADITDGESLAFVEKWIGGRWCAWDSKREAWV